MLFLLGFNLIEIERYMYMYIVYATKTDIHVIAMGIA